ncbi:MAG: redoxin domain-containing protein [Desulfuromonadales bacterium]|nr:redoxin domain-containing protein [Desulfuromonadales bacterium]
MTKLIRTIHASRFGTLKKTLLLSALFTLNALFMFTPAAATLQQLHAGMEAPDFSLKQISGESKTFADLKGEKLTVLIFWSTWDTKSEKALARMQKLFQMYREQGFSVVAINANGQNISDAELLQIRATADRLKLSFPILIDQGLGYFHDVGVIALPTTIIVDKDRLIKYEMSGYPLVGSEEMADFITDSLEGKKLAVVAKKGYQPNKNALRLFNMGRNTLKSGRMADTAEMWFVKAIEADPKFVLPHISLGIFYMGKGDTAAAKTQFKEALAKEPENVIALCESALLMFNDGKFDEGRSVLEGALKIDEYYTPCFYYSGFAYGKQGRMDEALKMFDEAARINPMDYNIYFFKGRVYEEQKKLKEASEAYRKALETALPVN